MMLKYMPGARPLLNLFSKKMRASGVVLLKIVTAKLNVKDTPEYLTLKGKMPTKIENTVHEIMDIIIVKIKTAQAVVMKCPNDRM